MGIFLHRTNKQLLESTSPNDLPEPIGNYIENPDMSPVNGFPSIYWTITGDVVSLQNQTERDATDAAILIAQTITQKTDAENLYDLLEAEARTLRAIVVLTVDELNNLRTQWRDFQTAVAVSTNLAQLKTEVAALPSLADRTYAQARTAIRNAIQGE